MYILKTIIYNRICRFVNCVKNILRLPEKNHQNLQHNTLITVSHPASYKDFKTYKQLNDKIYQKKGRKYNPPFRKTNSISQKVTESSHM